MKRWLRKLFPKKVQPVGMEWFRKESLRIIEVIEDRGVTGEEETLP